jgi:hypothetical protein
VLKTALLLLVLAVPASAAPREWFPLQMDLSGGATTGRLAGGSLGLFAGKSFGWVDRTNGMLWAVGGEGTLEFLQTGRLAATLGPELRWGWAWNQLADDPPVLPRAALYLRVTPMVTTVPLSVGTQLNRTALEQGTVLGVRAGLGVTASAWTSSCVDSYSGPNQSRTSESSPLSCLWCFVNHAEIFSEGYGRAGLVQYRFGFRIGAGI